MEHSRYLYIKEQENRQHINGPEELNSYWNNILGEDAIREIEKFYGTSFDEVLYSEDKDVSTDNEIILNIKAFEATLYKKESNNRIRAFEYKKKLIFSNFFSHFIQYAISQKNTDFSPAIEESYVEMLLTRLCKISISTLMFEMYIEKENGTLKGENPEQQYNYYNEEILADIEYIKKFFSLYPCLERLIYESIRDITSNYIELENRLKDDHESIVKELCCGKEFSQIIDAKAGLSDSHKKGKTVIILKLDNNYKIVYKPHSLDLEDSYQKFLTKVTLGCKYKFKSYSLIKKDGYGWTEFVENKECLTRDEVKRYYYRFGMLIFVNYILNTNDLHFENLIACGEYPMVIDAETALNNKKRRSGLSAKDKINVILQNSVLSSGLLPYYRFGKAGKGINMGAINGRAGEEYPIVVPRIKDEFTSNMHFEYVHPVTDDSKNLVTLNGEKADAADYIEDVVAGFSDVYKKTMEGKNKVVECLGLFENLNVRYLVQDTQRYAMLLHTSFHPDFLQNSRDRELFLSTIYSTCERIQGDIKIARAEIEDMLAMDIPYFYTKTDSRNLYTSKGSIIDGYFEQSGLDLAKEKIIKLDNTDMEKQCMYIQIALVRLNDMKIDKKTTGKNAFITNGINESQICKQAIEKITKALLDDAIFSDQKDDVNWIGVFANGNDDDARWEVRPLGTYLYEGISGIAVYFGALNKFYHNRYKGICNAIKTEMFEYTDDMLDKNSGYNEESSGIFCGESSLVYAYQLLYSITGEKEYLEYAEKHYRILHETWPYDRYYDIIYGNAGALLSVLNMFKLTDKAEYLLEARKIGEFLLDHQCENGGWKGATSTNILAGFSHGISGIAVSLIRLWKATGEDKYLNAALKGISYEDTLYDHNAHNWKDERVFAGHKSSEDGNYMTAWCHGAAGILLSRVKCYELLNNSAREILANDIHNALKTVCSQGFYDNNCLCHGNLGNAEILLEYQKVISDPQVEAISKYMFINAAANINSGNFDCRRAYLYGHKIPGFMTGMAGMGYELLKYIMPELPCVLSGEI